MVGFPRVAAEILLINPLRRGLEATSAENRVAPIDGPPQKEQNENIGSVGESNRVSADRKPVSADEIDAMILSSFGPGRSRKTAYVIGRVAHALEDQQRAIPDAAIFDRLQLLVDSGLLEARGDLSRWRLSEVRPTGRLDRQISIHQWVHDLEKSLPIDDVIDRVQTRLKEADAKDKDSLTFELSLLLKSANRYDEALLLIDGEIERKPDDVRYPISKAALYHYCLDDFEQALVWIDFALERAFRTNFFRREALGDKARILLRLGRGEELGQVLEQIMSLDMYYDVPDIGKERDFVDRAPPGLICEDIVARYNAFCPNRDRQDEIDFWVNHQREILPTPELIERVRSRLQDADDEDRPRLAFRLQELLVGAERYEDALQLIDDVITRHPDNVSFAIQKALIYGEDLGEIDKALTCIDAALERAFRTRHHRRGALGVKARILLALNRGKELGQVLEQIMSLQMFSDVADTARERDFVDDAPPGLIEADILARYDAYCPKIPEV